MDEETPSDGIYSTCPICFAIVASKQGHEAWHEPPSEGVTDGEQR